MQYFKDTHKGRPCSKDPPTPANIRTFDAKERHVHWMNVAITIRHMKRGIGTDQNMQP